MRPTVPQSRCARWFPSGRCGRGARLARALPAAAILATAAVLAAAAPAHAQVGQVNGTLTDTNRKPISGASVALIPKQIPTIYGTSSGVDGRYSFSGLPSDVVSVVVLPPGRTGRARKDGIKVRALFRSIVDFDLAETATSDAPVPSPAVPAAAPAAVAAPPDAGPPSETGEGGQPTTEPSQPAGPTASSLSCTVMGPDQKPVTEASVMVLAVKSDEGTTRRGRTDGTGACRLTDIPPGTYRILVRAPGFVTWYLGPVPLKQPGDLKLLLTMAAFPLGFEGTLEDMLVPMEPIPPGAS